MIATVNKERICRLCLSRDGLLVPIFGSQTELGRVAPLSARIMRCASIKVVEGDRLPESVCHRCVARVDSAFEFRVLCETSDTRLRRDALIRKRMNKMVVKQERVPPVAESVGVQIINVKQEIDKDYPDTRAVPTILVSKALDTESSGLPRLELNKETSYNNFTFRQNQESYKPGHEGTQNISQGSGIVLTQNDGTQCNELTSIRTEKEVPKMPPTKVNDRQHTNRKQEIKNKTALVYKKKITQNVVNKISFNKQLGERTKSTDESSNVISLKAMSENLSTETINKVLVETSEVDGKLQTVRSHRTINKALGGEKTNKSEQIQNIVERTSGKDPDELPLSLLSLLLTTPTLQHTSSADETAYQKQTKNSHDAVVGSVQENKRHKEDGVLCRGEPVSETTREYDNSQNVTTLPQSNTNHATKSGTVEGHDGIIKQNSSGIKESFCDLPPDGKSAKSRRKIQKDLSEITASISTPNRTDVLQNNQVSEETHEVFTASLTSESKKSNTIEVLDPKDNLGDISKDHVDLKQVSPTVKHNAASETKVNNNKEHTEKVESSYCDKITCSDHTKTQSSPNKLSQSKLRSNSEKSISSLEISHEIPKEIIRHGSGAKSLITKIENSTMAMERTTKNSQSQNTNINILEASEPQVPDGADVNENNYPGTFKVGNNVEEFCDSELPPNVREKGKLFDNSEKELGRNKEHKEQAEQVHSDSQTSREKRIIIINTKKGSKETENTIENRRNDCQTSDKQIGNNKKTVCDSIFSAVNKDSVDTSGRISPTSKQTLSKERKADTAVPDSYNKKSNENLYSFPVHNRLEEKGVGTNSESFGQSSSITSEKLNSSKGNDRTDTNKNKQSANSSMLEKSVNSDTLNETSLFDPVLKLTRLKLPVKKDETPKSNGESQGSRINVIDEKPKNTITSTSEIIIENKEDGKERDLKLSQYNSEEENDDHVKDGLVNRRNSKSSENGKDTSCKSSESDKIGRCISTSTAKENDSTNSIEVNTNGSYVNQRRRKSTTTNLRNTGSPLHAKRSTETILTCSENKSNAEQVEVISKKSIVSHGRTNETEAQKEQDIQNQQRNNLKRYWSNNGETTVKEENDSNTFTDNQTSEDKIFRQDEEEKKRKYESEKQNRKSSQGSSVTSSSPKNSFVKDFNISKIKDASLDTDKYLDTSHKRIETILSNMSLETCTSSKTSRLGSWMWHKNSDHVLKERCGFKEFSKNFKIPIKSVQHTATDVSGNLQSPFADRQMENILRIEAVENRNLDLENLDRYEEQDKCSKSHGEKTDSRSGNKKITFDEEKYSNATDLDEIGFRGFDNQLNVVTTPIQSAQVNKGAEINGSNQKENNIPQESTLEKTPCIMNQNVHQYNNSEGPSHDNYVSGVSNSDLSNPIEIVSSSRGYMSNIWNAKNVTADVPNSVDTYLTAQQISGHVYMDLQPTRTSGQEMLHNFSGNDVIFQPHESNPVSDQQRTQQFFNQNPGNQLIYSRSEIEMGVSGQQISQDLSYHSASQSGHFNYPNQYPEVHQVDEPYNYGNIYDTTRQMESQWGETNILVSQEHENFETLPQIPNTFSSSPDISNVPYQSRQNITNKELMTNGYQEIEWDSKSNNTIEIKDKNDTNYNQFTVSHIGDTEYNKRRHDINRETFKSNWSESTSRNSYRGQKRYFRGNTYHRYEGRKINQDNDKRISNYRGRYNRNRFWRSRGRPYFRSNFNRRSYSRDDRRSSSVSVSEKSDFTRSGSANLDNRNDFYYKSDNYRKECGYKNYNKRYEHDEVKNITHSVNTMDGDIRNKYINIKNKYIFRSKSTRKCSYAKSDYDAAFEDGYDVEKTETYKCYGKRLVKEIAVDDFGKASGGREIIKSKNENVIIKQLNTEIKNFISTVEVFKKQMCTTKTQTVLENISHVPNSRSSEGSHQEKTWENNIGRTTHTNSEGTGNDLYKRYIRNETMEPARVSCKGKISDHMTSVTNNHEEMCQRKRKNSGAEISNIQLTFGESSMAASDKGASKRANEIVELNNSYIDKSYCSTAKKIPQETISNIGRTSDVLNVSSAKTNKQDNIRRLAEKNTTTKSSKRDYFCSGRIPGNLIRMTSKEKAITSPKEIATNKSNKIAVRSHEIHENSKLSPPKSSGSMCVRSENSNTALNKTTMSHDHLETQLNKTKNIFSPLTKNNMALEASTGTQNDQSEPCDISKRYESTREGIHKSFFTQTSSHDTSKERENPLNGNPKPNSSSYINAKAGYEISKQNDRTNSNFLKANSSSSFKQPERRDSSNKNNSKFEITKSNSSLPAETHTVSNETENSKMDISRPNSSPTDVSKQNENPKPVLPSSSSKITETSNISNQNKNLKTDITKHYSSSTDFSKQNINPTPEFLKTLPSSSLRTAEISNTSNQIDNWKIKVPKPNFSSTDVSANECDISKQNKKAKPSSLTTKLSSALRTEETGNTSCKIEKSKTDNPKPNSSPMETSAKTGYIFNRNKNANTDFLKINPASTLAEVKTSDTFSKNNTKSDIPKTNSSLSLTNPEMYDVSKGKQNPESRFRKPKSSSPIRIAEALNISGHIGNSSQLEIHKSSSTSSSTTDSDAFGQSNERNVGTPKQNSSSSGSSKRPSAAPDSNVRIRLNLGLFTEPYKVRNRRPREPSANTSDEPRREKKKATRPPPPQSPGGKAHCCEFCDKTFVTADHLERHKQINHADKKKHPCSICGKKFTLKYNLKLHEKRHLGLKRFECHLCSKTFTCNASLQRHLVIHTGVKPFECPLCGRRFYLQGNMNRHFRTHTGERPYCCDDCGNSYADWGSLRRHLRSHTGERPYECSRCNKNFVRRHHLARHLKYNCKKDGDFQFSDIPPTPPQSHSYYFT